MQRPARVPAQLSESLHKRLNAYALAAGAAGVGVLALVHPAEAKIVYTPADETCPCKISLNNNGVYDFRVGLTSELRRPGEDWWKYSAGPLINRHRNRIWGNAHKSLSNGNSVEWAFALRSGALIRYVPEVSERGSAVMWSGECNSTGMGCFSTNYVGYWVNRDNRYLGLRFIISGKVHYGWARLNTTLTHGNQPVVVLTGYAYETIPNKAIIAGKTHGEDDIDPGSGASLINPIPDIPRPATLGALAMGSSGLSNWQRKQSIVAKQ